MFATFNTITAKNIQVTEELISDLQAELEAARQQLARFQQEEQAQLTAKAAAESALEAAAKAFKAVAIAYGENGVEEFKNALLAASQEAPQVPALPAVEEQPKTDEVEPTLPSEGPVVEVAAEVIDTTDVQPVDPTTEFIEEIGESPAENALDFSKLSWKQLQKLAASKGVSVKGKKKTDLLDAIAKLVTQSDIDQAA
ncbi:hypothetical protein F7734_58545 [Scytonema sp. UIC 10036]|uniref:hypothetical protein n=1 Tax=Scytonema sp. UIC 10036 TaxID=2304196 RepID=UPI0012DA449B|nr:hypothetical protein [Scytonema sp. UIC 10036]MUH01548.1 hypothetical protein [Scytonema sp. UIC 10036]